MVKRNVMDGLAKYALKPIVLQLVCVLFVVLTIWVVVMDLTLMPRLEKTIQQQEVVAEENTSSGETLATVLNKPLFGDYVPINLDAAGVKQSTLNVTVVGVLLAKKNEDSQVILQESGGQEHFYRVGDKLPDGSVIKRITAEGVLVLHEGTLERLSLPKDDIDFGASPEPLPLDNQD